ncbi:MAG: UDP-glucose 4-epimerase [Candidatus Falkowbacteria bacterium GW2011_GWF2_39_8]|uniref:UDP-glucose 4-epimerase n=1 Tax=Candidatus Falkowbacteria bacterium GW2011_GWF2_39_8 TaxID=1618642 RepID=A0A0G0PVN9_9BACT|nr:MAG: UDP-glucose 4-epimerase [Candidatus Falkowbacteria bacterium GW2011_GWF2_39_8]
MKKLTQADLIILPNIKENLFYSKLLVKEVIRELLNNNDIQIINGKITDDMVKIRISFPTDLEIGEVIIRLKKESSKAIYEKMPGLSGEVFWTDDSYLLPVNIIKKENMNESKAGLAPAKCLVTGGAGFIGSNLVDELIKLGHEVVIMDDLSSGKREYLNPTAKFYEADICDADKVEEIFSKEKFDFVFHLAAQIDVRVSVARPQYETKINVLGGLNILESCLKHKVEKFIFISTGGAIYGGEENLPANENYPTYPLSPYGINKLAFEKYLNFYHKTFGQKYITLRLANVYGPRQFKGGEGAVVAVFCDWAVNDHRLKIYGDGLQTRDFVYVGDVAEAAIKAMASDYIGELNIGTMVETNLLEIIEAIEGSINKLVDTEHYPEKVGEQRRSVLDNRRAKEILSWQPKVALEDGIKKTIEWTKSQVK